MTDFNSPEWWEEKKKQCEEVCGHCKHKYHETFSGVCGDCRMRDLKASFMGSYPSAGGKP